MALRLEDYKVGWITALPIEAAAAKAMLDTTHPRLSTPEYDSNIYTFGYINPDHGVSNGGHNVVIASGRPGTATAATVANDMRRTFPWLRIGLMVGIAGGVWSPDTDVRLGDVVVGVHPSGEAGVIQYDYGKQIQDKDFLKTTTMNKAPAILLNAVAAVQAEHLGLEPPEMAYVSHLDREQARRFSKRPTQDRLFNATYLHQAGSCDKCDERQLCDRPTREHLTIPQIHYGPIASGNRVIRDAVFAEKVRMKYGNLCFEMEAAGLDNFPSLTIRGISDYCDTHKNDEWHRYAAIAAAAYAKELLSVVPPTAVVQLPQLGNTLSNVPRAPNALFTGRQSLLDDMKKHLVTNPQKKDRPVFVLQGIGGAGKSEAAIKFAKDNQDSFWGIFWIDAEDKRSIEEGFVEIAKMQTPPLEDTTPKDVLRWLANFKETWLLILDNCDNANIDFSRYMPSRGGSVILTTRLTECKDLGTWTNLDDLGHETATQLLLRACGYASDNPEAHIPAAEAVVSSLGQHALALVHAGAYIKKGLCTLDEYVHFFRKEQARLMDFKPLQQASRYGSVYATFEISAEALASSEDHGCDLALRLLNILAFLDREAVEEDIFSRAFDKCHKLEEEWEENGMHCPSCPVISSMEHDQATKARSELDTLEVPRDDTRIACEHCIHLTAINDDMNNGLPDFYGSGIHAVLVQDQGDYCSKLEHLEIWHCEQVRSSGLVERQTLAGLRIARARLADLSLIKVDDNKISMHPLVHGWARTRLDKAVRKHAWEQTVSLLALSLKDELEWRSSQPRLVSHINTCFCSREEKDSHSRLSLGAAQALWPLAWTLVRIGKSQVSLSILETLSFSCEIYFHMWSPERLEILNGISWCLTGLGRYEEARDLVSHMVHHAEQEYGQMDPMTFDYKIRLATISRKVDGDQDALSMLEPLYECYSQLPRTNDERMARLLGKMTSVHQSLGHIEQAVFYAEKRFELWELDSPNSREWSSALSSLCDLYINNGQAEKAVTLLEDIFSLYYKTSSPNVEWVEILISLAEAHIELKRHSEAIPHVTEAFSQLAKLLSDDIEPSSLICLMSRLAKIYTDLDELSVAITVFEMRVNLESSDPSLDESERLLTLRELAEGYLELGDREKLKPAVELLEEVIEGQEILDTDVEELECTEKLLSYARWKLTRATRTQQSVASNIDQQSSQEEAATKLPASTLSEDETVTQQASYSCTDVAQAPRRNPSRKKRKHETMLEQATELDGSIVSGELEPKPRRSQRIKRRKTSDTQPRS